MAALAFVVTASEHHAGDSGGANSASVQAELDRLVASVGRATGDAKALHGTHGDVVDLGASLRLMEDKFTGLRNALMAEMGLAGAASGDGGSGGGGAGGAGALQGHVDELVTRGTEMIQRLAHSRSDVHALLSEIHDLHNSMATVKEEMSRLGAEVTRLGDAVTNAHTDHGLVHGAHAGLKRTIAESGWKVHDVPVRHAKNMGRGGDMSASGASGSRGRYATWLYLVAFEFAALVAFVAFKRFYGGGRGNKYSKLG
jgi:hypothetical protein